MAQRTTTKCRERRLGWFCGNENLLIIRCVSKADIVIRFIPRIFAIVCALVFCTSKASAQLVFNFTNLGGATPQMVTGFQQAGALWSSIFNDNITINVNINGAALGSGIIGSTSNTAASFTYTQTRANLIADKKSADDTTSTNNLQAAPSVKMLINHTSNNPNGANSATPYFDSGLGGPGDAGNANNNNIRMSRTNAKALGLIAGNAAANDGSITFSTNFAFDFNRADGINGSQIDFVGVAAHEIGHLLGFTSGVDVLDGNGSGFPDTAFTFVSTLDLFRFSSRSIGAGGGVGVIDWTADNTPKYFSVDGGTTPISATSLFSNGVTFGDGSQASHWKDGIGAGIMDPTAGFGELLNISSNDIRALDVIGYDLVAVPEPATCALFGVITLACGIYYRRCRLLVKRAWDATVD